LEGALSGEALFISVIRGHLQRLRGCRNTASTFATVSQRDAPLIAALARAAGRRVGDFSGCANTALGFATTSQRGLLIFAALATAAELRVGDVNAHGSPTRHSEQ
jgi:hypothetical protein